MPEIFEVDHLRELRAQISSLRRYEATVAGICYNSAIDDVLRILTVLIRERSRPKPLDPAGGIDSRELGGEKEAGK